MDLSQKNIGIAITGSYCTYKKVFAELEKLASTGANLYPIFSDHASTTDSRFGKCADFLEQAEKITGKKPITTIPDAEPIGPGALFDILVIAPCTGIPWHFSRKPLEKTSYRNETVSSEPGTK